MTGAASRIASPMGPLAPSYSLVPLLESFDGVSVASLGGSSKPTVGCGLICFHAPASGIHGRQRKHGARVVRLGALAIPAERLGVVLVHKLAFEVGMPEN